MSSKPPNQPTDRATNDPEVFDPENLIGTTMAGRYLVEQCIGRGGMGVVYLGSQQALDRQVVIKVLRSNLVEDDEAMARFEREAQGLSKLHHPNIVTIFDFGYDNGRAFIVMEFVNGETLSRRIRRDGPFKLQGFMQAASQILQGIGEAHTMGLLHRDIKPANIMLAERHGHNNFIKILDFGLAKLASGGVEVTKDQSLVGSAAFLSPEQIVGLEIDQRVDVYALGVLFYYMISGKRPFKAANDAALLYKHVHEAPEPLDAALPPGNDIPPNVIQLIHHCLAKNPNKRPQDANELLAVLNQDMTGMSQVLPWSRTDITPMPRPQPKISGLNPGAMISDADAAELPAHLSGSQSVSLVRTPSGNLQVIPIDSSSNSFSRDQSFILAQQPKRSNTVPILLGALLLVGIGIVVALLTQKSDDGGNEGATAAATKSDSDTAPNTTPPQPQGPSPEELKGKYGAILDKAAKEVDSGDIGKASARLQGLSSDKLIDFPELEDRAADLRVRISVQKLLASAERDEASGATQQALEAYGEILTLDPKHAKATERFAAINKALAATKHAETKTDASIGLVTLFTTPKTTFIYIDGAPLMVPGPEGKDVHATTPLTNHQLPIGTHKLELRADHYRTWRGSIDVTAKEPATKILELQRVAAKRSSKKSSKPKATSSEPAKTPPPTEPAKKETKKPKKDAFKDGLILSSPGEKKKKRKSGDGGLLLPSGN